MRSGHRRWHRDEVFVKITGERPYSWRAVDHEGQGPESFMTKKRGKNAGLQFLKKTLRRHGHAEGMVADRLCCCGAALNELGIRDRQEPGRRANNRSGNSHLPFRRRARAMRRVRRERTLQKFASVHALVHNRFNQERSLLSRAIVKRNRVATFAEWRGLMEARQIAIADKLGRSRIRLTASPVE